MRHEERNKQTRKHMKKVIVLFVAAAMFAGAVIPTATAEEKKKPEVKEKAPKAKKKRSTYPYRGVIGSIEGRKITLKLKTKNRVIMVAEDAKVTKLGKPAKLADIKAGAYVTGSVKKVDGKEVAVSVYEKPKPEPKKGGKKKTEKK